MTWLGSNTMVTIASQFSNQRYVLLRSLLNALQARQLYEHTVNQVKRIQWVSDDQVPETPALYGEPCMEELLLTLLPSIEEASDLSLYPTYSYLRLYKRGDVLGRHVDRPACEISVSLSLGYEADSPWPLWIEGPAGVSGVQMEPGDGLLYRGTECFHWREAFSGTRVAQVFLHYVDRNGVNAGWKGDKRQSCRVADYLSHLP